MRHAWRIKRRFVWQFLALPLCWRQIPIYIHLTDEALFYTLLGIPEAKEALTKHQRSIQRHAHRLREDDDFASNYDMLMLWHKQADSWLAWPSFFHIGSMACLTQLWSQAGGLWIWQRTTGLAVLLNDSLDCWTVGPKKARFLLDSCRFQADACSCCLQ